MKGKNIFPLKTGHAATDAYLKQVPVWYDTDLLLHTAIGGCVGFIVGFTFGLVF